MGWAGGDGGEEKVLSLFRFHLPPFLPETPDIQATASQKLLTGIKLSQQRRLMKNCERFEPRSHFKSRLSLIVRVNVVLNRNVVVDSDSG